MNLNKIFLQTPHGAMEGKKGIDSLREINEKGALNGIAGFLLLMAFVGRIFSTHRFNSNDKKVRVRTGSKR